MNTEYSDSFDYCVNLILKEEGGYVDNKQDPGGKTRFGISQRQYPYLDIATLTEEAAREIYHMDYWTPVRGDDLPKPVALCVFDCAVNQGVGSAIRLLQGTVGADVDGQLGPQTMLFLKQRPVIDVVNNFMADRALKYSRTPNYDVFGKGWTRRLFRIHTHAARIIPA